jgi:hypothetical protein
MYFDDIFAVPRGTQRGKCPRFILNVFIGHGTENAEDLSGENLDLLLVCTGRTTDLASVAGFHLPEVSPI